MMNQLANAASVLRDALSSIAQFERLYSLSSDELLQCMEGDPRVEAVDGFDLIEWYYALEQIKVLGGAGSIHAVGIEPVQRGYFRYAERVSRELSNSPEAELLLVA